MMLMDQRKIESGKRKCIKGQLVVLNGVFVLAARCRCDKASIVDVTISRGHGDMNSLVRRTKKQELLRSLRPVAMRHSLQIEG